MGGAGACAPTHPQKDADGWGTRHSELTRNPTLPRSARKGGARRVVLGSGVTAPEGPAGAERKLAAAARAA